MRIVWGYLLTWRGLKAVAAIGAVSLGRIVPAGGILSVEDTADHLAHALAELRQELDRVLILPLRLLRIAVALRRIPIARSRLLIIGRWLAVLRLLRIRRVGALALGRGGTDGDQGSAQTHPRGAAHPRVSGSSVHGS